MNGNIPRWTCPGVEYPDEPKPKAAPKPKPKPKPRRIDWSLDQVIQWVNDDGYRVSDCARMIGVTTTCLFMALKKNGFKYDPKPPRIEQMINNVKTEPRR